MFKVNNKYANTTPHVNGEWEDVNPYFQFPPLSEALTNTPLSGHKRKQILS